MLSNYLATIIVVVTLTNIVTIAKILTKTQRGGYYVHFIEIGRQRD